MSNPYDSYTSSKAIPGPFGTPVQPQGFRHIKCNYCGQTWHHPGEMHPAPGQHTAAEWSTWAAANGQPDPPSRFTVIP
jgi:hypothetical protein